jgi:hypothetical protein
VFIRYGVRTNTTIVVSVGVSMVAVSHMDGLQFVFPSGGQPHRILAHNGDWKLPNQWAQPNLLEYRNHPSFQSSQKDGYFMMMLDGRFGHLNKLFRTGVTPIQNSHSRMIPHECHLGIQTVGLDRQHSLIPSAA